MHGLVENLLMLARLGARQLPVSRERVDVSRLVDECFSALADKAFARQLRFENLIPKDVAVISDREKLRIVVSNLLANAVEYTPSGEQVVVANDARRGVLLDVSQSGPALPDSALETIFHPFFRLEPSRAGSGEHCGIGLALVRAICEALGLSATAHNPARGGVAFRVTSAADAEQLDILGLDPSAKDTPPGWQETAASASR
jgi:signal transduction histidine kinase